MKRILALLVVTLTLSAAHASEKPNHRLYYLDKTRNVFSVDISASKKLAIHPRKLTSGGGYDGYSVSPDGNQVFGWKQIGLKHGEFMVFKCFLEKGGRLHGRILDTLEADYTLSADWSPQCKYLIVYVPGQVEKNTIIYSLERRKVVCDTTDLLPDFCADQAYSFVLEDVGDLDNSPAWLRVLDMRTGKMTKVAQVNYGVYGHPLQYVWFGTSHRFAFIDTKGNLGAGEVSHGKLGPVVKKRMLTKYGGCSDLRYIAGKGIYFIQKTNETTTAYYCSDLRTLGKTAVQPLKNEEVELVSDIRDGKVYSPDRLLCAAAQTGKPGDGGTIKVYDKSGHCLGSVKGTRPRWRGGAQD